MLHTTLEYLRWIMWLHFSKFLEHGFKLKNNYIETDTFLIPDQKFDYQLSTDALQTFHRQRLLTLSWIIISKLSWWPWTFSLPDVLRVQPNYWGKLKYIFLKPVFSVDPVMNPVKPAQNPPELRFRLKPSPAGSGSSRVMAGNLVYDIALPNKLLHVISLYELCLFFWGRRKSPLSFLILPQELSQ